MTSSLNNIDFINSINRIVNIDINNSNLNKFNNADDYFDLNNISSTNDDNSNSNSNNNTFSKEDDYDSEFLNDEANSLSSRIADLTELDNLLDDLYNAKKSLAASNSLNHNMNTINNEDKLQPPTLNVINHKEKLSRHSLNDSTRTSTSSSSSPTSLKSNLNQNVSSASSTASSSLYYNQLLNNYNNNNSKINNHNHPSLNDPNGLLANNAFNYSINEDYSKPIIQSSSSSSYTNSFLNDDSKSANTNLINTRRSVEKLINSIDENNLVINRPNMPIDSFSAAKELENLMASLTMYKNEENKHKTIKNENNLNRTNSSESSILNKSNNSLLIKYDGRPPLSRTNSLGNQKLTPNQMISDKNLCAGCNKQIIGQVITALGHLWHPEHFVCYNCNCSIGTNIFYEKDNKPYCENDYIELFSPKCASCTKPILDKMLTALNKSWHIQCFQCRSCSKNLNDESFLEINDCAYCKNCYVNELAPKCKRCNKAIIENFISALDCFWHPSCFVCVECGLGFNSSSFYEYLSMPYCELHYHLKRGSLCSACQQPINGRCITAMNKKYHPEHFNCSFCLKELNKGTFKEQNEKPYCNSCYIKLFP